MIAYSTNKQKDGVMSLFNRRRRLDTDLNATIFFYIEMKITLVGHIT